MKIIELLKEEERNIPFKTKMENEDRYSGTHDEIQLI